MMFEPTCSEASIDPREAAAAPRSRCRWQTQFCALSYCLCRPTFIWIWSETAIMRSQYVAVCLDGSKSNMSWPKSTSQFKLSCRWNAEPDSKPKTNSPVSASVYILTVQKAEVLHILLEPQQENQHGDLWVHEPTLVYTNTAQTTAGLDLPSPCIIHDIFACAACTKLCKMNNPQWSTCLGEIIFMCVLNW